MRNGRLVGGLELRMRIGARLRNRYVPAELFAPTAGGELSISLRPPIA
jgi:hypothetical protein